MEKIAIDLTWVRHKLVGGTESSVRNLLHGFGTVNSSEYKFVLFTSQDNYESFDEYSKYNCFEIIKCDVYSANQLKRVIWQNTQMCKMLKKLNIKKCIEPIYGKPIFAKKNIDFYTIIHDLQALHYPEYFSKMRNVWMKLSWNIAVHSSRKVIAISEYVRQDILNHFHVAPQKVITIYDAIDIDINDLSDETILQKYNIERKGYYYTVSSLLPHKNLKTVVEALSMLKEKKSDKFLPIVISGVGGKDKKPLLDYCEEKGMSEDVIITSFVDNPERNRLYKECRVFLFPSIFEGFGMPPIEAMAFGCPVLTTKETSIEEVTDVKCNYVDNALCASEWAQKIESGCNCADVNDVKKLLEKYAKEEIAKFYIKMLSDE